MPVYQWVIGWLFGGWFDFCLLAGKTLTSWAGDSSAYSPASAWPLLQACLETNTSMGKENTNK